MSTAVSSPPRGAPLRSLNPFGGASTNPTTCSTANCRNYLWVFVVLLLVWAVLVVVKPEFVLNVDKSLNYQRVFWISVAVSAVAVLGLCMWSRQGLGF